MSFFFISTVNFDLNELNILFNLFHFLILNNNEITIII